VIRTVADSNIYLSAILFGGRSDEIRRLAIEGTIQLFVSELILAEIAGVLKRKFKWSDWQIAEALNDTRAYTTLVTPAMTLAVIKEDEADNRVLECAVEAKAQYIVSGDKRHLQPLGIYEGIKVLSLKEFLDLFK